MKIRVKGAELKKVDIDFLSLVHRGANRAPFKVIKAEDAAANSLQAKTGLLGSVQKFFSIADPTAKVVAVFVNKAALAKTAPNLADAGFILTDHVDQDDAIVFKQDGFNEAEQVIVIKSEENVAFAVSGIEPYADVFNGQLNFDDSVAKTGFYPGLNEAMKSLQVAMNVSKTEPNDLLKSFHAYTAQIKKAIPESVFKFESLQRGFAGATNGDVSEIAKQATVLVGEILKAAPKAKGSETDGVQDQASSATGSSSSQENQNSSTSSSLPGSEDDSPDDEDSSRSTAKKVDATETGMTDKTVKKGIRPIVFKDDKGVEFHQAVSPEGLVMKYTAGAKIPEGHTTMTEQWDQDPALGGTNNGNGQGQGKAKASESADNEVEHTGAGGDRGNMDGKSPAGSIKKEDLDALITAVGDLPTLVAGIAKSVSEQSEMLKGLTTRLETVEKTATTAIKKADRSVVHVGANYDSAMENLGGRRPVAKQERTREQIAKAQYPEDLWTQGSPLGIIDQHRIGEDDGK